MRCKSPNSYSCSRYLLGERRQLALPKQKKTAPEIRSRPKSNSRWLPRRWSWRSFAFLSFAFTLAAALLSALSAILFTLRLTLRLNLLATFATATSASPAADILRPWLDVFFMPVSLVLAAFGIVFVLQIRVRIL